MCSCNKKPLATNTLPPEVFTLDVEGAGAQRVYIAARRYSKITVNGRLYTLQAGQSAPMYNFEALALIEIGVPIWIESLVS